MHCLSLWSAVSLLGTEPVFTSFILCRNIFDLDQAGKSISHDCIEYEHRKTLKSTFILHIHLFFLLLHRLTLWASKCCRSLMDAHWLFFLLATFCNVRFINSGFDWAALRARGEHERILHKMFNNNWGKNWNVDSREYIDSTALKAVQVCAFLINLLYCYWLYLKKSSDVHKMGTNFNDN